MPHRAGDVIGGWTLVDELGSGATGRTWACVGASGRRAALKILPAPPGDELRALSGLRHPSIVGVLDGGGGPPPFLVMELASGRTLQAELADPAPTGLMTTFLAQVAAGLAAAHEAGVQHGDVKPENIIVDRAAQRAWLVDFGFAGSSQGGTPAFLAPERLEGGEQSPEADVYALGLTMWWALLAAAPWAPGAVADHLALRVTRDLTPAEGPRWLTDLLCAMLRRDPAGRPTAAGVTDALVARGAVLHIPRAQELARQAATLHLERPGVALAISAVLAGGRSIGLYGAPGMGKTHELRRLTSELRARGAPHVVLPPATTPWADVAAALADPHLPQPPALLPRVQDLLRRATEAAEALAARSTAPDPLLVVADDFDSRDPGCQVFLRVLAAAPGIRVVTTAAQPTDIDVVWTPLTPLEPQQVDAVVDQLFGASHDNSALKSWLAGLDTVNPGRAAALLTAAVAQGAVVHRRAMWVTDEGALSGVHVDDTARPSLGPDASAVGALLAAIGRPIRPGALADLAGLDPSAVDAAVEVLEDLGIAASERRAVHLVDRSAGAWLSQSPGARERHRRALAWLEALDGVDPAVLLHHAIRAEDRSWVAEHAQQTLTRLVATDPRHGAALAEGALRLAPSPEGVELLMGALVRAGRADDAIAFGRAQLETGQPPRVESAILTELVHLLANHGRDLDGARQALQRATDLAVPEHTPVLKEASALLAFRADEHARVVQIAATFPEPPPHDSPAAERWLRMQGLRAQALHELGDVDAALALLDGLPRDVGADLPARALLEAMRGRLLWHAGRVRDAAMVMDRIAQFGGEQLPPLERARLLNNAAIAHYETGDVHGATQSWEHALLLFQRMGAIREQVQVEVNLCVALRGASRLDRAVEVGTAAFTRATERQMPALAAMAAGNLGDVCLTRRDLDGAGTWYERARELATAHDLRSEFVELARREAERAALAGRCDAEELARTARDTARQAGDVAEAARADVLLALAQVRAGTCDDPSLRIQPVVEALVDAGASTTLNEVRLWAARAYLAHDDPRAALQVTERALAWASEMSQTRLRDEATALAVECQALLSHPENEVRLERVMELALDLARERQLATVLSKLAQAALALLRGERAFVLVQHNGITRVEASALAPGAPAEPPSSTIVERALVEGREVVIRDMSERRDLQAAESVVSLDLRSALCVPLIDSGLPMGALYVDGKSAQTLPLTEAARLMRTLAAFGSIAVANARHLQDVVTRNERGDELAHDLRNALTGVFAVASMHQDDPRLPADVREDLTFVKEIGQHMLGQIKRHLGRRASTVEAADVAALSRRLVGVMRRQAEEGGVRMELEAPPRAPFLGDADELLRALSNVVSNALTHSPRGGTVWVRVVAASDHLLWSCTDQGPGLPEGEASRLFQRRVQGEGAKGGYGLGLAIAERIVRGHGGSIRAFDAEPRGACFEIKLPAPRRR